MAAPTLSQVHIKSANDRISIAYRNENYVATQLFPVIPVQHQSDEFFVFDKSSWFRNEAGPRAPGTRGPQSEYSISSCSYACRPVAHTALVPDEIVENADNPLDPRRQAIEFATDKVLLYLEVDVAAKAFGNSVWSSSATPGTTWDNDASDPITDVQVGVEAVVALIGREPNVMIMGRNVWTDLRTHPDLLALVYPATAGPQRGLITPAQLATIFGVDKLLIGNAIYTTSAEGTTATYSFVWGKHALLAYVPPAAGLMVPAAGYIFAHKDRVVETFRRDEEKTDVFRVEMSYACQATAADAGYLFKSCVA